MKAIKKITSTGGGTPYVTIPRGWLKVLDWKRKQKLELTQRGRTLVIRDARSKRRRS